MIPPPPGIFCQYQPFEIVMYTQELFKREIEPLNALQFQIISVFLNRNLLSLGNVTLDCFENGSKNLTPTSS